MASASAAVPTPSQTYLSKELSTNDFEKLNRVLDISTTKVTFWGKRVIVSDYYIFSRPYKGSYSLNTLASKMLKLGYQRCSDDSLTDKERLHGINIANKIHKFYEETDKQIKNRNFLTRFFVSLRKIFSDLFLYYVDELKKPNFIKDCFLAYSIEKYEAKFGKDKKENSKDYKMQIKAFVINTAKDNRSLEFCSEGKRIVVSESEIRNFTKV